MVQGLPPQHTALGPVHWHQTPQEVVTLAQKAFPSKPTLNAKGGKAMPNQSATQPPRTETRTKENPNALEWKVPTLADLLQRLSVSSASSSLKR
jgi:hypothetical protein